MVWEDFLLRTGKRDNHHQSQAQEGFVEKCQLLCSYREMVSFYLGSGERVVQ